MDAELAGWTLLKALNHTWNMVSVHTVSVFTCGLLRNKEPTFVILIYTNSSFFVMTEKMRQIEETDRRNKRRSVL